MIAVHEQRAAAARQRKLERDPEYSDIVDAIGAIGVLAVYKPEDARWKLLMTAKAELQAWQSERRARVLPEAPAGMKQERIDEP